MLSQRVLNLEESATLAMTAKGNELKQAGKDVISLSIGEPDFDTRSLSLPIFEGILVPSHIVELSDITILSVEVSDSRCASSVDLLCSGVRVGDLGSLDVAEHSRDQDRCQNADDRDNDDQLNQGKTFLFHDK